MGWHHATPLFSWRHFYRGGTSPHPGLCTTARGQPFAQVCGDTRRRFIALGNRSGAGGCMHPPLFLSPRRWECTPIGAASRLWLDHPKLGCLFLDTRTISTLAPSPNDAPRHFFPLEPEDGSLLRGGGQCNTEVTVFYWLVDIYRRLC